MPGIFFRQHAIIHRDSTINARLRDHRLGGDHWLRSSERPGGSCPHAHPLGPGLSCGTNITRPGITAPGRKYHRRVRADLKTPGKASPPDPSSSALVAAGAFSDAVGPGGTGVYRDRSSGDAEGTVRLGSGGDAARPDDLFLVAPEQDERRESPPGGKLPGLHGDQVLERASRRRGRARREPGPPPTVGAHLHHPVSGSSRDAGPSHGEGSAPHPGSGARAPNPDPGTRRREPGPAACPHPDRPGGLSDRTGEARVVRGGWGRGG